MLHIVTSVRLNGILKGGGGGGGIVCSFALMLFQSCVFCLKRTKCAITTQDQWENMPEATFLQNDCYAPF